MNTIVILVRVYLMIRYFRILDGVKADQPPTYESIDRARSISVRQRQEQQKTA